MPVIETLQTRRGAELEDVLDRLPQLWRMPPNAARDGFAILLIFAVCASAAWTGAVHTRIFGHDIFVMLDGGWRVLHNQRPAVDFHPGVGFLLPLIMAAGLKLAHYDVRGVGYASALVGVVVGLWSYAIARNRVAWTPAALISLLLTLTAVAPYPLGWAPNTYSHAMVYNRYGYALLGIVLLESFQPSGSYRAGRFSWGGFSSGVLCAFLLFLKPSYGLVALVFAACSVLAGERRWRRPAAIVFGISAGALVIMAWLGFDFEAVYRTVRILSGARSSEMSWWSVRWSLAKGFRDFLVLSLLVIFLGALRSSRVPKAQSFAPWTISILVVLGGALLLATNAQAGGYPLNAVLAILFVEQALTAATQTGPWGIGKFLRADIVVVLVGLLLFGPELLASSIGVAGALLESRKNPPVSEAPRFEPAHLASLSLFDVPFGNGADDRSNGRTFVTYVNDGLALIQAYSKSGETIYTLDIVNPFSYALLRAPAAGGADVMALNHQFNDEHKPTADQLFGSADILMVPKHPSSAELDARALFRNYLPDVQAKFRLCAEDAWWQLYKRPSQSAGCPIQLK